MKERIQSLMEKRLRNRRNELRDLGGAGRHAESPRGREVTVRLSLELEEVESALRRLGNRTYGICRQCGTAIAHGRLYNVPHTDRCTRCAVGA